MGMVVVDAHLVAGFAQDVHFAGQLGELYVEEVFFLADGVFFELVDAVQLGEVFAFGSLSFGFGLGADLRLFELEGAACGAAFL